MIYDGDPEELSVEGWIASASQHADEYEEEDEAWMWENG